MFIRLRVVKVLFFFCIRRLLFIYEVIIFSLKFLLLARIGSNMRVCVYVESLPRQV